MTDEKTLKRPCSSLVTCHLATPNRTLDHQPRAPSFQVTGREWSLSIWLTKRYSKIPPGWVAKSMRYVILLLVCLITVGLLACNSNETLLSQKPVQTPAAATPPPGDNARRITADELHKLWEKGDVVIIDTRPEAAYKSEHIKGSVSMPAGTVLDHLSELPRTKTIAAYCT